MHEPHCRCPSCRFVEYVDEAPAPELRTLLIGFQALMNPMQFELFLVVLLSEALGIDQEEYDRIVKQRRAGPSVEVPAVFYKE